MQEISWIVQKLSAFKEGLYCVELLCVLIFLAQLCILFRHIPLLAFVLWRCHARFNFKNCFFESTWLSCEQSTILQEFWFFLATEINVLNTLQKPSVHIAHCNALYMCAYGVCQTFPNSIYFLLVSYLLLFFVQRFRFHYFGRFSRLVSPLRNSGKVTEGGRSWRFLF